MKFGPGELILILIITLVIFGPSRLPELGEAFGKTVKGFRSYANKEEQEVEDETDEK